MSFHVLLSLGLRAATIGSKFLLIISIARILPTEQLGVYGLFTATVNYSLYVVGLDYYTYTTRELLGRPLSEWAPLIRDQAIFYCIVYVVCFPLLLVLFGTGLMPWKLVGWFYIVLAIEHLSQELFRLLVALKRPLLANFIAFLRLASWVYAVLFLYWYTDISKDLTVIWWGWSLGGLAAVGVGLYTLFTQLDWSTLHTTAIDRNAMKSGLKISTRFLVATLSLRAVFTLDRYWVESFGTLREVGIYSFYMSMANSISSFLEAGVVMIHSPKIIQAYQRGDIPLYDSHRASMKNALFVWLFFLSLGIVLLMGPLLAFIGKTEFNAQIEVLYWLMGSVVLLGLSNIPHYDLYAKRKDRVLVASAVLSFISFAIFVWPLSMKWGMAGVASATTLSMAILLILKWVFNVERGIKS